MALQKPALPPPETAQLTMPLHPPPPATIVTLEDILQSLPPLPTAETVLHALPPAKAKVLILHRKMRLTPPSVSASASASPARRRPLIPKPPPERGARCAEVAGGTTAECAAVVCCCPCGLVNLLVLAVLRLPAGLCRQAIRKRMKRGKKAVLIRSTPGSFDEDFALPRTAPLTPESWPVKSPFMEVSEKEKEMWAQFNGAGFWRSQSQKE